MGRHDPLKTSAHVLHGRPLGAIIGLTISYNQNYYDYQKEGGEFMKDFATVPRPARVRTRGQVTIPQDIREEMNLDAQATINLFRVGKVLLMTPKRLERASLARKVEREMKREGLTLNDLLADLKSQRERYLEKTSTKD